MRELCVLIVFDDIFASQKALVTCTFICTLSTNSNKIYKRFIGVIQNENKIVLYPEKDMREDNTIKSYTVNSNILYGKL